MTALLAPKLLSNPQTRTISLLQSQAYINGQWVCAETKKTFKITNPVTLDEIGSAPDMSTPCTRSAIDSAFCAFKTWSQTTAKQRSDYLRKWYNLMVQNHENLAKLITLEAGKPITEARNEVSYGNSYVEFFAEETRRISGEILQSPTHTKQIYVEKHPIGVVGLITAWNFPHSLIARKAAAALAAGCTCVIKPAEDTPLTALALMRLAEEAGIPKGVLNVVTASRDNAPSIGRELCQNKAVAGVSFTGSTTVGKIIYQQCASGVKRLGLELSGNAPFIVYNSANLNKAVKGALLSKFRNCGQTCVSSNRFLVQCDVYDKFLTKLVNAVKRLKMGDVQDPSVEIGSLINQAQLDKVTSFVEDALCKGAKVEIGGQNSSCYGPFYYQPTVLTDIKNTMKVYKEEVFGPVISIMKFETEEESMKIANDTPVGLAGYFYTEDVAQMARISKQLQVGMLGMNEGEISMAEAPFGGVKESGIGREGSHLGVDDFLYVKYICLGGL